MVYRIHRDSDRCCCDRIRKLIRSNRKTFKNKLCAIALLSLGLFAAIISNDWTFFVFTSFLAIPLLVAKKNYIYG